MPGLQIGLVDGEALGVGLGDELRLSWHGEHMRGVLRLAETHVVVAAHRVAVGLEIDVGGDVEVHATTHILDYQTVTARGRALEVDVPHVGADEALLTGLLLCVGHRLPEGHRTGSRLLLGVHVIEIDLPSFPCLVVALTAVAQPLVEVGGMPCLVRCITDDVHMHGFRRGVPHIEADGGCRLVGADTVGDADRIAASLSHRLRQLDEQPVVELARQRVIGVHRLRLPPDVHGLCRGEGLVVGRADAPECGLLRLAHLQSLAEHEQGVVALGERMPQIGARSGAVVTVVHLTVTEMHHQVVFVDDMDAKELGRHRRRCCQEQHARQHHKERCFLLKGFHLLVVFMFGYKDTKKSRAKQK